MIGLFPLLKKEIMEQLRTYRLLIVGSLFLMFGITTPLMMKYLPQLLELSGAGMEINIPPPTAVQSLAEYSSTIGQIGVLVAVLLAMGSVSNEVKHGTAVMTLSKPVSRAAFVNAKFIASSLTFLVSLVAASILCYFYTLWLIGPSDVRAFIGQNLLLGVFLLFCLSVTLLFSSLFKSSLAAGGSAIGLIVSQGILSAIPRIGDVFPGKLLGWGTLLLSGGGQTYWPALIITLAFIVGSLWLAGNLLRRKEI